MLLCRAGSGAPETRTGGGPSRRVAVRAQDRAPARAVRAVVELQPSRARAHTAVDARTFFLERWKAKKKTRRSWREDGAFGRRSPTRPQAVDDGNGNKGKKLLKKIRKETGVLARCRGPLLSRSDASALATLPLRYKWMARGRQ